ncbi:MAG TPA: chalcone isomerase family protein [Thermoanaerobaculia bacterium]|nr:chalcone isomerase family protein [Thermoanaerobaculia bacterium]
MKKTAALALGICLAIAAPVLAKEVSGVTLTDTATVEGKTVKLNGAGLRKKVVFKVYVGGLYLENPSKDAATVISSDQIKRMQLSVLRSLSTKQVTEAIEEGFEKNSKAQMGALKSRLEKLKTMIPNVENGDQILLTYVPGRGTVVSAKGAEKGVIEGKDFADALFAVWLGPNPVQEDLKKALLGG